jgi:hypothetical protein
VDAITYINPAISAASAAAKRAKWIKDAEAMPVAAGFSIFCFCKNN